MKSFFVGQGLYLVRNPDKNADVFDHENLWQHVRININLIEDIRQFSFHDHTVEAIYGTELSPETRLSSPVHHDRIMGKIFVSVATQNREASNMKYIADEAKPSGKSMKDIFMNAGHSEAAVDAMIDSRKKVFAAYPNIFAIANDLRERTIYEEVRHGINAMRVDAKIGKPSGNEYINTYYDAITKDTGFLGKQKRNVPDGERVRLGMIYSEIAAQMTAAAVSRNPHILIGEWRTYPLQHMHPTYDPKSFRHLVHDDAAITILQLLQKEMKIKALTFSKNKKMILVADALLAMPSEKIRLALKNIYAREFHFGAIDESPFPAITAEGKRKMRR